MDAKRPTLAANVRLVIQIIAIIVPQQVVLTVVNRIIPIVRLNAKLVKLVHIQQNVRGILLRVVILVLKILAQLVEQLNISVNQHL